MLVRWAVCALLVAGVSPAWAQPAPSPPPMARQNPPLLLADSSEEVPPPVEAPPAVPAAAAESLGLEDFEQLALQWNPTLAGARARVEAARGNFVQAGLYPNPMIGYHATEVGNLGTAGAQGAFLRQRVITAGKRRLDQDVAAADVDTRQAQWDTQRLRVLGNVRVRFFDALAAQQRVDLTRQLAQVGDDLARTSSSLFKARQASENDVLQAEIEAEQTHILYDNARFEYLENWRRLTAVVGSPQLEPVTLEGSLAEHLPELSWEVCLMALLERSPELAAAEMQLERARRAAARARREWIPNVDVGVSVRHANVSSDDIANIEVGIPIPVFDANQGNIRRAEANIVSARAEAQRIELALQDRLAIAFRRYTSARRQVERYQRQIVSRAQRSLELVRNGFQQGQVDYLTLLTAQRTFYRVSLDQLEAQREQCQAAAVIGSFLLSESLEPQIDPVAQARN